MQIQKTSPLTLAILTPGNTAHSFHNKVVFLQTLSFDIPVTKCCI